jgi:hypothetical protein
MRTDETHPPLTYYPPFFYAWTTAQFGYRIMEYGVGKGYAKYERVQRHPPI